LGNRDGEVLDEPQSLKTKEESKLSVLDQILQPALYPELYKDYQSSGSHQLLSAAGDNKEAGIMLIFLAGSAIRCRSRLTSSRDSILAAPLCLDLVLFLDWHSVSNVWHTGMALFLFQKPADSEGILSFIN